MLPVASGSTIAQAVTVGLLPRLLVNAIACHALVNVLSGAWRYSSLYIFELWSVSFLLWMFWRMEGLLQKVQRKPLIVISGSTPIYRYWQMGLALLPSSWAAILFFSPGKKSHSFESISGVLRKFWLF